MKAAVYNGKSDFSIQDIFYPKLEEDGVIIKVRAAGICGSDLHVYRRGGRGNGWILGHEFSGDIVEVGEKVRGVAKGDRATVMTGRGCGQCYFCQQGDIIHCSKLTLLGYGIPGAFAEYVSVPSFNFGIYSALLPDSLTYEVGATVEPLSVALYAVKQVQAQREDYIAVIGLGIIGICIVQILKSLGFTRILVSGHRANRLKLAKQAGAAVAIDAASNNDIVRAAGEFTSGKGIDAVFECAGTPATFQQALDIVHRGSKINLVGLYEHPVTWNPGVLVSKDITLIGCGLRWDIPGAVKLLTDGQADTRPLITHSFPLEKIKEAFETQLNDPNAVKVLLNP
jgi:2-desacetyl-2-hydroxyethyl bacteriochlorophyllide A dehydrogenase